ncbi:ATP-binding protein [Portibacter lacus]|uniref:ATPase AAA n=1 Tax=Portibacter lacus TaxID=1099794 RepID=A0AA37SPG2_9BACT|nr:AAA family ATPase [Portibacter lacus]GLR17344.1 ATPase AAA [Portibacter lacus]
MESLYLLHNELIKNLNVRISRFIGIDWNDRLIALAGPRGVGKTTFLLERVSKLENVLYVTLDDLYFTHNSLLEVAAEFVRKGGKHLYIDEVHKYPNWSRELKNIYDRYSDLNVVFSGSSILHIHGGDADLSRRAVIYNMKGLSFREYIQLETGRYINPLNLSDIFDHHEEIAKFLVKDLKPLKYFEEYLKTGYFPFYLESKISYASKLLSIINLTLETDLPYIKNIESSHVFKLKKLLYVVSKSVPFKPNISKLSRDIEVSRATILTYLSYMEEAKLIKMLSENIHGDGILTKPEKIYLDNPNLTFAIARNSSNIGNARETFFLNQVKTLHDVTASKEVDFIVDECFHFEIGDKNKSNKQLKKLENSFIAADDIEYGYENKIPLWMFGLLY